MLLRRTLRIDNLLKNKSFFLFGPRATGKSTLIREQLKNDALVINLLKSDQYLHLSERPSALVSLIEAANHPKVIVIDEVQKLPELLNEVHWLIEEKGLTFLLTGSSARKLRRKGVNLLAGRAREAHLMPLTSHEIPEFKLERYLFVGGLPSVYLSDEPGEELRAYVGTYLQQEIQAEALVRKLPAFARFLKVSALTSGQIINFSSVSSDASVPAATVREYYQILEDTFMGFMLDPWTKSVKRKSSSSAKFYFFDIGVRHKLLNYNSLPLESDLFGQAFEHFIGLELRAFLSYSRSEKILSFWHTYQGDEVDFLIGDDVAIEVKSCKKIHNKHLKGLRRLQEEKIVRRYIIVSQDTIHSKKDGIECLHWKVFLSRLWSGNIL